MPLNLYLLAYPTENLYTQRIEGRLMTCYNQSQTNQHECGLNRCSVIETGPREASHDVLGLFIAVIRPYLFKRCLVIHLLKNQSQPGDNETSVAQGKETERTIVSTSSSSSSSSSLLLISFVICCFSFFILKDIWIDQGTKLCGTISKTDNRKTDRDCGQRHAYLCEKPVPGVISLWWHTSI